MNVRNEIKNRLLELGIKPSVQRMAIMEYLTVNPVHPTVDTIFNALYASIPTLSKTTVYNTLKLLSDQGAICALNIDEKNMRYDADISRHAHFKCKNCRNVFDLKTQGVDSIIIENEDKFVIKEAHFYFTGYCQNCKNIIDN
ncbi:MAG: transcriptional repressor [Dysgonamonadaceae bacterium]|jgi:Fe2+ or Zn2+ uptake regulation protein|nr:transcriptional repressor [Dysgonamonadaceae bacterium]